MKKILFVGEHPFCGSGNGNMLMAILSQMDARVTTEDYEVACFVAYEADPVLTAFNPLPISLIPAGNSLDGTIWGSKKLLHIIETLDFDILCMVGIDVWIYGSIFEKIAKLRAQKGFKWIGIFPYDVQVIRKDWAEWFNYPDIPCVYSQYGEQMLKPFIPHIRYFRPPLNNVGIYQPFNEEERAKARGKVFGPWSKDRFIFGFVGKNQVRKDPQRLITAFFQAKKEVPHIGLYLHTELDNEAYNLREVIKEHNDPSAVLVKTQGLQYSAVQMRLIYNSLDCLVNCSLQEGLSWTPLEAMLCGTPVIASETTAQTEMIKGAGLPVPCQELTYLPAYGSMGHTYIEAKSCKVEHIREAIKRVAKYEVMQSAMRANGLDKAKQWLSGVSDILELFEDVFKPRKSFPKINKILFAQESSAGDVLMTTRCFKGLKERHPDIPLVYMTDKRYMDIIKGNPYVDEIIPWDSLGCAQYDHVYQPHKDSILNGMWGRNSVGLLSDLYWRILEIEPDDFYIDRKKPEDKAIIKKMENVGHICILHTTGGDARLRTFEDMVKVSERLKTRYYTIQLGAGLDYPAQTDLDLRGQLSFRETAWVMSKASIAITVDSFLSHLAGMLGINQIALFGCGSPLATRPIQTKNLLICRSPDYITQCHLLGHCSGTERMCPYPCINVHKVEDILKDIEELEFNLKGHKDLPASVILKTHNSMEVLV